MQKITILLTCAVLFIGVSFSNGATITTLNIYQEDFEGYDVENPSDFSAGGTATGNWISSNPSADATRIFNTGNFGGSRLWISNVDGTTITSNGIDITPNTAYTFSAFLACETYNAARQLDVSYDLRIGTDIDTSTSVLGGPAAVVAYGDDWDMPDSKEDHVYIQDFATGSINPDDKLFISITRTGPHEGSLDSWFAVDDVAIFEKLAFVIDSDDDIELAEGTGLATYNLQLVPDSNEAIPQYERYPSSPVYVTISPDEELMVDDSIDPLIITFPAWTGDVNDYTVTIEVSAVDDDDIEGPHTGIITAESSSSDIRWDGKNIIDIIVNVIDDDGTPGITINLSKPYVEEGGIAGQFTIVLDTPPAVGNVVDINIFSVDGQLIDANDIQFDSTNWSTPQIVSVIAVDDVAVEGLHSSSIRFIVGGSDTVYAGWEIEDLGILIGDNELTGPTSTAPYAWYQADAGVLSENGFATDGENVIFIADSSGNLRNLANPHNGGPVYSEQGSNGLPSLRFDDSQAIWISAGDFGTLTQPNVIFLMAMWDEQYTAGDAGDNSMFFDGAISSSRQAFTAARQDLYEVYNGAGDVKEASTEGDRGNTLLHTIVFNGADTQHYINGQLVQSGDAGSGNGLGGFVMGARVTLNETLEGNINEMIIYPGALSDTERKEIEAYLFDKWIGPVGVYEHNGFESAANDDATVVIEAQDDPESDSYDIIILNQRDSDVEVTATPAADDIDLGTGPGNPVVLTFAAGTGAYLQTVTVKAVDNATSEGPRNIKISHTSSSNDIYYNGVTIMDVEVVVGDNEEWCGQEGTVYLAADLNHDCYVTLEDFAVIADSWLKCTHPFYVDDCIQTLP